MDYYIYVIWKIYIRLVNNMELFPSINQATFSKQKCALVFNICCFLWETEMAFFTMSNFDVL